MFGFAVFVTVGMLFVFGVVAVLGWRHDEAFARQQLVAMGYEEVVIGERRRTSRTRFLPTATYFSFRALKGDVEEGGYLVCRAIFEDVGNQWCDVNTKLRH